MNKNGQTLGSKFENFRNGAVFIMFWKTARDKPPYPCFHREEQVNGREILNEMTLGTVQNLK